MPGRTVLAPFRFRRGNQIGFGQDHRAGTDDAHIADEYVDKLRQFIDAQPSQRLAYAGNILAGILQLVGSHLTRRRHIHGTELEHGERNIVLSHALLNKQRFSSGINRTDNGNYQKQRGQNHQSQQGYHYIKKAFSQKHTIVSAF